MTLSEAAELAGISLDEFSQKLGLPLGVNPHEQLGRLRKAHDFDIYDVRQIVSQQTTPKNTPQQ
jgi:predicted HTH domain antitoxin